MREPVELPRIEISRSERLEQGRDEVPDRNRGERVHCLPAIYADRIELAAAVRRLSVELASVARCAGDVEHVLAQVIVVMLREPDWQMVWIMFARQRIHEESEPSHVRR